MLETTKELNTNKPFLVTHAQTRFFFSFLEILWQLRMGERRDNRRKRKGAASEGCTSARPGAFCMLDLMGSTGEPGLRWQPGKLVPARGVSLASQHLSEGRTGPTRADRGKSTFFLSFIHLDLHLTIRRIHLGSLWSIAKYTNTTPCVSHCFKHSHGSWLS